MGSRPQFGFLCAAALAIAACGPTASFEAFNDAGVVAAPDAPLRVGPVDAAAPIDGFSIIIDLDGAMVFHPPDAAPQELAFPWTPAPLPAADYQTNPPACSANDWLAKFMAYRSRYRAGFVGIGDGPGMGIPATLRDPTSDCGNDWQLAGCRNEPIPGANGAMRWGDSTIWVGWYLKELGVEWAALHELHLDTTQTEQDIAYALDALDRVDAVAETLFGDPPLLDGFFVRDDITQALLWTDDAHTQLRFPRTDGQAGFACVQSEANCGTPSTADGSYISEDQFIEMLPGLAMVAKLVPPSVMIDGKSLAYRAQEFTHRVTSYLKRNNWKIVDPQGNSPPNQWGGTAAPYSTKIAEAANFITNNAFGVADYGEPGSAAEAAAFAEGAAVWAGVDTGWAAMTLNNQSMVLALASVTDDWGDEKLSARGTDWDAPVFAMVAAALHGRPLPAALGHTHIESMLTSAPCGGPCSGTPNCEEVPGWKGEHRFKSPEDRDGDYYGVIGEYGGLDYMLLWGLYVHLSNSQMQMVLPLPPRCSAPGHLADIERGGAAALSSYDPWDSCNWGDLSENFCGRPWAVWLDAAYHGTAHIFIAGGELVCSGRSACTVVPGEGQGTDGEDLFIGSAGNDEFVAGDGDDCLYGFDGDDRLEGERGSDEIHGGNGNDTLCGESCDFFDVEGEPDLIFGDAGDDTISGGPGPDMLHGGDGNDTITGATGFDRLFGEAGDDYLDGELGDDICDGGEGNDTIYGGDGDDRLVGGPGRDKLDGGDGDDFLDGGDGDDILFGDEGADTLYGGNGSDRLCGGCGEDQLHGGWDDGVDSCRGEAANICFTNTSNTTESCETDASASDCRDAAFDAW